MTVEMFNKSRAQEMKVVLDNLKNDHRNMGDRITDMTRELRNRCPHPDEFVVKLDDIKMRNPMFKPKSLYMCKLCGTTTIKGD